MHKNRLVWFIAGFSLVVLTLGFAWLPFIPSLAAHGLTAIGAVTTAIVLATAYLSDRSLWWLPACAGGLIGLTVSILGSAYLPQNIMTAGGIALSGAGLGLALVSNHEMTPIGLLAVAAVCLFASTMLLLSGLGYRLWMISLVLLALGYDLAVTSIYLPSRWLYAAAIVAGLASVVASPQPAASLRFMLPLLLVLSGLVLIQVSRRQPVE